MSIIVQKYGGSSVRDMERIQLVARKVAGLKDEGHQVVVVVSAMGDTTDELLKMAHQVTDTPDRRELDMLLSCGERVTMALLSMAVKSLGHDAISFTGSQCGIMTNDSHFNARIVEVRPFRIQDELERGRVVIVAGYQGTSYRREVTTLGRGGSDTTAVALAAALDASCCEIYSDVDGVYSGDPNLISDAKHIDKLLYDEMQELSRCGARVLNEQAVEFARKAGIAIYARASAHLNTPRETIIRKDMAADCNGIRVMGITGRQGLVGIEIEGDQSDIWQVLEESAANIPHMALSTGFSTPGSGRCLLLLDPAVAPLPRLHKLPQPDDQALNVQIHRELSTVSAVGTMVGTCPHILSSIRKVFTEEDIPVLGISMNPSSITLVIPGAQFVEVQRLLHGALIGKTPEAR